MYGNGKRPREDEVVGPRPGGVMAPGMPPAPVPVPVPPPEDDLYGEPATVRPSDRMGAPTGALLPEGGGLPTPAVPPQETMPLATPPIVEPGSPGTEPFRTPQFGVGRVQGGPAVGPTGPGAPLMGGLGGFSEGMTGAPEEDELLRAAMAGLMRRRG